VSILVGLSVCIANIAIATTIKAPTISETEGQETEIPQTTSPQIPPATERLKSYLAYEVAKYGNPKDYFTLENLIQCESSWDINSQSDKSSAHGLAQFLIGTWNGYCSGDRNNPYSQIHCLVLAWNDNKQHWWDASRWCWGKYFSN
jgi:hypothetical protein